MSGLDTLLDRLESRIAGAEAEIRSLRAENSKLREALETRATAPDAAAAQGARPLRLVVLEAERQDVRARLRNLLQAL